MAKVQMLITGPASGKFGTSIFSQFRGENIMKGMPFHVSNPKTEKQVSVREKFLAGQNYLRVVEPIVKVGWNDEIYPGRSALNVAASYTLKNAMQQVGGLWVVDPTKLMHSKGPLFKAKALAATNPSGQTIIFTWIDESGKANASPDDTFNYVYYNTTVKDVEFGFTTQKRSDQTYSFAAPADWTGNDVAVYAFFRKADGTTTSDDVYCGTLTLH